jgi:AcrR family transcriptional regulator
MSSTPRRKLEVNSNRADGIRRREALLDAALTCFFERGVLQTGIEDIRKAAGASPSSVYHLFDGLSEITLALLLRTFQRLFDELAARVLAETDARAAVRSLVEAHLDWVRDHPREAHFLYQSIAAVELSPDQRRTLVDAKNTLWQPILEHLLAQLAEASVESRWSALPLEVVLLGPTHEACRRFLAGAEPDMDRMRSTLPDLAWTTIGP